MRLIDADALIEKLEEKMFNSQSMCPVIKITDVMSLIDEQPTAYDPEKVADCLKKASTLVQYSKRTCKFAIEQDLAVQIVRKGSIK